MHISFQQRRFMLGKAKGLSVCSLQLKFPSQAAEGFKKYLQHIYSFQQGFISPASADASLLQYVLLSFLVAL